MRKYLFGATVLSAFLVLTGCGEKSDGERSANAASSQVRELIVRAARGDHRSEASRARNVHRNPVETLLFFGLRPDMTVVEVWPGGGWYTEVLAPVLRERGRLIAASFPADAERAYRVRIGEEYVQKLRERPQVYDRVEVIGFDPPAYAGLGEPGSADMVLLSRHFHNFINDGITDEVLAASFEVLRPGGVLAVIQHRAPPDAVPEAQRRTGYVREDYVIEKAEEAGFRLDARSEINANPKDPRAHPAGVWTLPPSLRHCRGMEDADARAACEERYRAIGESDRMTMRFIKPLQ